MSYTSIRILDMFSSFCIDHTVMHSRSDDDKDKQIEALKSKNEQLRQMALKYKQQSTQKGGPSQSVDHFLERFE